MATVLDVNLVRTPGTCGGKLRVEGTGISVNSIVVLHQQGLGADEIVENYPRLSLREVYAVLAWYHEHKTEFDVELASEAAEYDRLAAEFGQAKRR